MHKQTEKTNSIPTESSSQVSSQPTGELTVIEGRSADELAASVPTSLLVALLGGAALVFCGLLFLIWALPH